MAVEKFQDDDDGYRDWVARHDGGFVINIIRNLSPAGAHLHRATCRTINGEPARGDTWTSSWVKICSTSRAELHDWAEQHVGEIMPCGTCQP